MGELVKRNVEKIPFRLKTHAGTNTEWEASCAAHFDGKPATLSINITRLSGRDRAPSTFVTATVIPINHAGPTHIISHYLEEDSFEKKEPDFRPDALRSLVFPGAGAERLVGNLSPQEQQARAFVASMQQLRGRIHFSTINPKELPSWLDRNDWAQVDERWKAAFEAMKRRYWAD